MPLPSFASQRTNQQWINELCGIHGGVNQKLALQDLATFLYTVAYNYLRQRQPTHPFLCTLAAEELAAMAQDHGQELLFLLTQDNFSLLGKFRNEGKFLNWCARMICNAVAGELRRPFWRKREEQDQTLELASAETPEHLSQNAYVRALLDHCLDRLPDRQQVAFTQLVIEELPAKQVAGQMETTEEAVYQLVYRAKINIRLCLKRRGFDENEVKLFLELRG